MSTTSDPLTLDAIYRVPNPWDTLEQRERYVHQDLGRQTRGELLREREALRMRLVLDNAPGPWLLERLEMLRRVLGNEC